jgi:hypothetical protein
LGIPQAIVVVQRLAQQIETTLRLVPALGVAAKRFVARRAAAVAGSGSAAIIPPGHELSLLAPQPVTVLPIDAEIIERLHLLGLRTIGGWRAVVGAANARRANRRSEQAEGDVSDTEPWRGGQGRADRSCDGRLRAATRLWQLFLP